MIDQVKKLVESQNDNFSPIRVPSLSEWNKLENELGFSFNENYKELLTILGDGWIGLNPLRNPAKGARFSLTCKGLVDHKNERSLFFSENQFEFPYYPTLGGLFHVLGTGTRVEISLLHRIRPEAWGVVVSDLETGEQTVFERSFSSFLLSLYLGDLTGHVAQRVRNLIWTEGESFFKPAKEETQATQEFTENCHFYFED